MRVSQVFGSVVTGLSGLLLATQVSANDCNDAGTICLQSPPDAASVEAEEGPLANGRIEPSEVLAAAYAMAEVLPPEEEAGVASEATPADEAASAEAEVVEPELVYVTANIGGTIVRIADLLLYDGTEEGMSVCIRDFRSADNAPDEITIRANLRGANYVLNIEDTEAGRDGTCLEFAGGENAIEGYRLLPPQFE